MRAQTYKVTTNFLLAKEFYVNALHMVKAIEKVNTYLKEFLLDHPIDEEVQIIKITEVELDPSGPIILG